MNGKTLESHSVIGDTFPCQVDLATKTCETHTTSSVEIDTVNGKALEMRSVIGDTFPCQVNPATKRCETLAKCQ